ncbi:MAG: phosphoribosylglycinamide formyltransferase [Ignavibacteria bacterium]
MNISVFASGTGSNFLAILKARKEGLIRSNISLLITNNSTCGAVSIARKFGVEVVHISRKVYPHLSDKEYANVFLDVLFKYSIDLIVLAGYMKMVEPEVVRSFKNRIINIHPALLPMFGGKGMYGINVHKAVIQAGVKVTGITIHCVNENYDEGKILFQKCIEIDEADDEYSLQKRVLELEHRYYPYVISLIEEGRIKLDL